MSKVSPNNHSTDLNAVSSVAKIILNALGALLVLVSFGCSTTPKDKLFNSVKNGMPKYEVLELLGQPRVVRRVRGQDHWFYTFTRSNDLVEKEIHFEGGRVIYAGDPRGPDEKSRRIDDTLALPPPPTPSRRTPLAGDVSVDDESTSLGATPPHSQSEPAPSSDELSGPLPEAAPEKPKKDLVQEMENSLKPNKKKAIKPRVRK